MVTTTHVLNNSTTVDGQGLWRAWKRGFTSNVMAFKDLLDNAVDAAFPTTADFNGRIEVYPDKYESTTTGICLRNNCVSNVPPLDRVLVIYESSKVDSGADAVGENGVGLKQACAALSDHSFVLVKRGNGELSFGVISESLQTRSGPSLPSFTLTNNDKLSQQISSELHKEDNIFVRDCVAKYGVIETEDKPSFSRGLKRICEHFHNMNNNTFEVILDRIRHQSSKDDKDDIEVHHVQKTRVANLMREIKQELPKTYLHIPDNLGFYVDSVRIDFKYWPQRLVELSLFTIKVSPTIHWYEGDTFRANDDRHDSYELRIFCGFDADRACDGRQKNDCSLFLHSRNSGRLISSIHDARHQLHLTASGSDYAQGLTIIMDDINGRLPLNPTKQDVAFAEERRGAVHKENLYELVGAVAKFYYDLHRKNFEGKTQLNKRVCEFGDLVLRNRNNLKRCHDSDLTTYGVNFKRVNSHIRVGDSKVVREGLDTLRLVDKKSSIIASPKNNTGRKRTSASTSRSNPADAVTTLTTTRKRPAAGTLREAQSDSDEEEEISEMRVPRRKKPSTQKNRREEEEKKDDDPYNEEETITIRKKDYEDLIKERDELKEKFDDANELCGTLDKKLLKMKERLVKLKKKMEKEKEK